MAQDTLPPPPFYLAYLAKALKCAGLGEVGYFILLTTDGIPDNTIFSLFVKLVYAVYEIQESIYACSQCPMKSNTCSVTLQMARRGLQFLRMPLMGFEAGVGAGITPAVGKAYMHLLSGHQLCTYPDHGWTS
jgi:hypothetical protein